MPSEVKRGTSKLSAFNFPWKCATDWKGIYLGWWRSGHNFWENEKNCHWTFKTNTVAETKESINQAEDNGGRWGRRGVMKSGNRVWTTGYIMLTAKIKQLCLGLGEQPLYCSLQRSHLFRGKNGMWRLACIFHLAGRHDEDVRLGRVSRRLLFFLFHADFNFVLFLLLVFVFACVFSETHTFRTLNWDPQFFGPSYCSVQGQGQTETQAEWKLPMSPSEKPSLLYDRQLLPVNLHAF